VWKFANILVYKKSAIEVSDKRRAKEKDGHKRRNRREGGLQGGWG